MRKWLNPERQADQLILAVTALVDKSPTASAFANGLMFDWLDAMAEEERFTPAAREAATYAVYAGYVLRMVEEAKGTARPVDRDLLQRLERVRADTPEMRRREHDALINDPGTTGVDGQCLAKLAKSDLPDHGEREVLDALVLDSQPSDWFTGSRFLDLTGYSSAIWNFFTRKLAGVLNANLAPDESQFPWEAIRQLLRLGLSAEVRRRPERLRASYF